MTKYIDGEKLAQRLEGSPLFDNFGEDGTFIKQFILDIIEMQPAEDVVEIEVLKAWLYKIALNNVGVPVEDVAEACERIIPALKYLRVFAKERSENGT